MLFAFIGATLSRETMVEGFNFRCNELSYFIFRCCAHMREVLGDDVLRIGCYVHSVQQRQVHKVLVQSQHLL